jgi:carboxypeptidase Q
MGRRWLGWVVVLALVCPARFARAQSFTTDDAVLQRIWDEGMQRSQLERLGQVLLDSLGPRLTGTPESEAASNWVQQMYRSWGIEARPERYGTWMGWKRGPTSLVLTSPRTRSLEGTLLAWSPGTDGAVDAPAVVVPAVRSRADLDAFVASARGKLVLLTPLEPSCRPAENWQRWATESSLESARAARAAAYRDFAARLQSTGIPPEQLIQRLEQAGVAGILTSRWPEAWGVQTVHDAWSARVPSFDLSCEDYGLVYRLAANGQSPVLRVHAESQALGEVPVWNTIGEIRGAERPNEYVMLSAHFDSWDSSSGATDNGAGTITMMEAMRILKSAYPAPRRTILVGHWNGEEQGLNGSRAFAADNPEIVRGLHALFNQDEGTGRITRISMQGLAQASGFFRAWLEKMPAELVQPIEITDPGAPSTGGSDEAAFICAGAPAFRLSSLSWDYGPYTWHTNRDTFDKLVFDDLKRNATLAAMLAYLASEEPGRIPDQRAALPVDPASGQQTVWPACRDGLRRFR